MIPADAHDLTNWDPGDPGPNLPAPISPPVLPRLAETARRHHPVTLLQVTAWTVANMSYGVPNGRSYRAHAADLYEQDLHERVALLFAELDAQNLEIEIGFAAA